MNEQERKRLQQRLNEYARLEQCITSMKEYLQRCSKLKDADEDLQLVIGMAPVETLSQGIPFSLLSMRGIHLRVPHTFVQDVLDRVVAHGEKYIKDCEGQLKAL